MSARDNSRWLRESYWGTKTTDDMEDRVSGLRRSRKGRVVARKTRKKLGLPVPSKEDHDLDQEQDAIEISDIEAQLRVRSEEEKSRGQADSTQGDKNRLQRGNQRGKRRRRRSWRRVRKPQ